MSEKVLMNNKIHSRIFKICLSSVFAALVCAGTFVSIPLPFGYFNLGDIVVLLSAWTLGPLYGALAAAIGSGLADLLMSYALYIPATVIIKSAMAVCAYFVIVLLKKAIPRLGVFQKIISAVCAEVIMISGYFAYEFFLIYGKGALASVFGNLLQGICAVIGSVILGHILEKVIGKS